MNRAVLYARVSSKDQEREGFSIPAQLDLLRSYAAGHRLQITQESVDVETAKQAGRAAFGKMVAFAKKHRGRLVILVEKTDRLYRNLRDWVTVDELDVEIHLVKEAVVLSPESRSHEKFMHGIKVLMAKSYVEQPVRGNAERNDREGQAGDLALVCSSRLPQHPRPRRQKDNRTGSRCCTRNRAPLRPLRPWRRQHQGGRSRGHPQRQPVWGNRGCCLRGASGLSAASPRCVGRCWSPTSPYRWPPA
jgi:hypothetical protein